MPLNILMMEKFKSSPFFQLTPNQVKQRKWCNNNKTPFYDVMNSNIMMFFRKKAGYFVKRNREPM